jgi:hypothetical protein
MNLFKILFGNKIKPDNYFKMDKSELKKLLESDDTNKSIIQICSFVSDICMYSDNLDVLTEPQKIFYLNQELEIQVNNGGFKQFFFENCGEYSHETVDSLQAIKAYKTSAILQEAINQFPGKTVPKDPVLRDNLFEELSELCENKWNELDDKFFKYEEDLNLLNLEYIREHKDSF